MLFSYIVGHVHVNSRKNDLKMRNLLRKYKNKGFFTHPLEGTKEGNRKNQKDKYMEKESAT